MSPERTEAGHRAVAGQAWPAAGNGQTLADFDIAPFVRVAMGNDLQACRDAMKPELALYIGGMGARSKNFYNDYAKRLGYEAAAVKIQDAYLAGRRDEAIAAVPDALIDETALVGPPERIKDRLQAWKAAGKTHEDRHHAAGRRQHRCAARRRRSRALKTKTAAQGGANAHRPRRLRGRSVASPFFHGRGGRCPRPPALDVGTVERRTHMPLFFLIAIGAGALTLGATAIDPAADVRHQHTARSRRPTTRPTPMRPMRTA